MMSTSRHIPNVTISKTADTYIGVGVLNSHS